MKQSKRIGVLLAIAIVAGNLIGSGLFLLPAGLAAVGSASIIGWIIATAGAVTLALVFAALAGIRPETETLPDYPRAAFHPAAGFVAWFAYWVANWSGNIAILVAAVGYANSLFGLKGGPVADAGMIIAFTWLLVGANLIGARFIGRAATATLFIGLLPVAAAIIIGLSAFDADLFAASWNITDRPATAAVAPLVLTIFWAFLGVESANAISGVVENPRRNVAIAAVGGVLLSALVYVLATTALFGLMPARELAASTAPFADAIAGVAGAAAGGFVAAAALARTLGCTAGWILVTAETGRAGARLGYLPRFFSTAGSSEKSARDAIVVGALMTAVAVATISPTLNEQFLKLVDFTVLLFLLLYFLCSAALIRFALTMKRADLALLGGLGTAVVAAIVGFYFAG